jgi:hypothetical protein
VGVLFELVGLIYEGDSEVVVEGGAGCDLELVLVATGTYWT